MRNKTEFHRKKIIEYLTKAGINGINSKYLILEITPRYSARIHELKKQGYTFRKVREELGGSNFDRVWLAYNPFTKQSFATSNDRVRKAKEQAVKYRYEFIPERQVYRMIPA